MAVILCGCGGESDKNLGTIRDLLTRQGETVFIIPAVGTDSIGAVLGAIARTEPLVIGGGWCQSNKDEFMDVTRKLGFDPFALKFVATTVQGSPESAVRMLIAAVRRMKRYQGARPENLKPRMGRPDENMSRRQFFTFPKIRHDVIPSIDGGLCRRNSHQCRLCARRCAGGAIAVNDGGLMVIEKYKCNGCGSCVNVCPAGAIYYPGYTTGERTSEIEALLSSEEDSAEVRRAVLFVCEESDIARNDFKVSGGSLPDGVFPITVPCICMLSPLDLFYPIFRGAARVGIRSCSGGECKKGQDLKAWSSVLEMTSALLAKLGMGAERIAFIAAENPAAPGKELSAFGDSLKDFNVFMAAAAGERTSDSGALTLRSLINTCSKNAAGNVYLEGYPAIPFGMVLPSNKGSCTLCGVCEKHCPADALAICEENGRRELLFDYGRCVSCGECVRICPEKALTLKRALDAGKLAETKSEVIVADTGILCRECGSPFLNEALKRRMATGLSPEEAEFVTSVCPDCRMSAAMRASLLSELTPDASVKSG